MDLILNLNLFGEEYNYKIDFLRTNKNMLHFNVNSNRGM